MASFRTGFKIFRDISLKQGLGRIRSFSEDRKPGQWLPEDQWAVRQPGSTCPEPCDKPRKPPKTSKSWLSICREPDKEPKEPECDIRHNNCPPPETKESLPWYSLDNLIPKKKQESPPPLSRCREEIRRRQMLEEEDEVCEKLKPTCFPLHIKPDPSECIMPKEPCPAPVVNILCPLPKEVDISLWCERPCRDPCRIPIPCQSDRLPYSEFRPKKTWKPPPFSLPIRGDLSYKAAQCNADCIIFSEFKQVEVPKPLYTRYKSVELCDQNLLFCMTNVTCPDDETAKHLQIQSRPLPNPCNSGFRCEPEETEECPVKPECPEKPVLEAASCKPVRIKRATVCKFRPKPTKLIEKRVYKRPCAHITCDPCRPPNEEDQDASTPLRSSSEAPKVITGTLTDEPQVLERCFDKISTTPPSWMYQLCKPGCHQTPLVPCGNDVVQEPDWCSETDGLKFYDGKDGNICPKPSPDPWAAMAENEKDGESPCCINLEPIPLEEPEPPEFRNRFVLMPEQYNIKYSRKEEPAPEANVSGEPTFEKFVQKQTAPKSFPQMKENILYDLQRLCPNPPLDPSVFNAPCRKPPDPECSSPPKFYRSYSTLTPARGKLWSLRLCGVPRRTECDDTSGKCKPRRLVPKAKECSKIPPKIPRSYHISRYATNRSKTKDVGKVKCLTLQHSQVSSDKAKLLLGLKDAKGLERCEFEPGLMETAQRKTRMRKGPESPKRYTNVNSPSNSSLILRESAMKAKSAAEEKAFGSKELSIKHDGGLTFKPYELSLSDKDLKEKPTVQAIKDENSVGLYEQNEENSKAFMESIGSWINDLFNVPNKRNLPPKNEKEVQKELAMEDDAEYLKSIITIKEQFRKKLKTETSVHISVPDTPFELNFDKILDNPKKPRKRAKPHPLLPTNSDWLDELNDNLHPEGDLLDRQLGHGHTPMIIRSGESENDFKPTCCPTVKPKNSLQLAVLDTGKGKRKVKTKSQTRLSMKDLEDHVLPKSGDISKKMLLNGNDQEKFSQFYKNSHLGAPDYVQRKGKTYQSNTRCYTTKAKIRGKISSGTLTTNRNSHYSSAAVAPAKSFAEFLAKNPLDYRKNKYRYSSRKAVCELTRDPMSFSKIKTAPFPPILESKNESKSTSDDLVKHLIKRIKSSRPHLTKTKGRTRVPQVLGSGKNRFMQSATNSLVMTVMAKREENHLTSKSTPRLYLESKQAQAKELVLKQSDTVMRMDFAKDAAGNKFDKTNYLPEEEHEEEYYDNTARRNTRQSYDDIMKRELSKSEKYHRRQEVKRMLFSLDMNSVFQASKPVMKKEPVKKLPAGEEVTAETAVVEASNPRFQKQHELFRKGLKAKAEQIEQQDPPVQGVEECKKEAEVAPTEGAPIQAELTVIAPDPVVLLNDPPEKKVTEPPSEVVEQPVAVSCTKIPEPKVKEPEITPKKSLQAKPEKKPDKVVHLKEKTPKSRVPVKEIEPKSLMRPLLELCVSENHKEASKPCELQIHPKDLIPSKMAEPLLINRRFSTTSIGGNSKVQGAKLMPWNYINPSLYLIEMKKDKDKDKDKCKDKEKDKEKEKEYRKERGGEHCYKDPAPREAPKKEKREDYCSREYPTDEKKPKNQKCGFDKEKEKPGPSCKN